MNELERLTIIDAIRQLKARYFRTLDSKDWSGYEAVFTPDLVAAKVMQAISTITTVAQIDVI